jgi:predicted nucleotidyltransferase
MIPHDLSVLAEQCRAVFERYPEIRRAYIFGSIAEGTAGLASDLDIALVGPRGADRVGLIHLGFRVVADLSIMLSDDRIDVVVLNATDNRELRHAVIADGQVIFDRGDDLDEFEMWIRHEYEDHRMWLARLGSR